MNVGFSQFYPEETFYSCLARNHRNFLDGSYATTYERLFDFRRYSPSTQFASRLDSFYQKTYPFVKKEKCDIVNAHTLYPLHEPFLSQEKKLDIYKYLYGIENKSSLVNRSRNYSWDQGIHSLQYCPRCYQEDIRNFREPYWHRSHQVLYLDVCPYHNCLLKKA
jgi:hypothetical protein